MFRTLPPCLLVLAGCTGEDPTKPDPVQPDDPSPQTSCTEVEWFEDDDGDGYGVQDGSVQACEAPDGFASVAGDCAPDDASAHPGGVESPYDGADNDCDAATLDDDLDGDDYALEEDCDDADPARSPAATERPDGIDNDCDSVVDRMFIESADAAFTSTEVPDYSWTEVQAAGDVDGDGVGDLLVAIASVDDYATGVAYLFRGPLAGEHVPQDAEARITWAGRAETGSVLAGGGDVDGDSFADVLVGSPESYIWAESYMGILRGPLTGEVDLESEAYCIIQHVHTWDMASHAVFADLGGEATSDLIVGDWGYGEDDFDFGGAAWVIHDPPAGAWTLDEHGLMLRSDEVAYLGSVVESADLNADGAGDVLISSGWASDKAFAVLSPLASDIDLADADITALRSQYLGAAGDLDADGAQDVLMLEVDLEGESVGNAGTVVLGPASGTLDARLGDVTLEGQADKFTYFEAIGDFDGDGADDLLATDGDWDGLTMGYLLLALPTSGTVEIVAEADAVFESPTSDLTAQGVGDLDADGLPDIVYHGLSTSSPYVASMFLIHSGW